ncbi:MAG: hypothetical protein LBP75_10585, partial [Planctomycetota bacterium]|nr:hypothetical protein [Planctomycetota bacterium]
FAAANAASGGESGSPKRGEPSNCGWRFAPSLPRVARLIEHRRLPWADMFRPCRATVGINEQNCVTSLSKIKRRANAYK